MRLRYFILVYYPYRFIFTKHGCCLHGWRPLFGLMAFLSKRMFCFYNESFKSKRHDQLMLFVFNSIIYMGKHFRRVS